MRKFVYAILLLSFSLIKAQVNEKVLTDTIAFVTSSIGQLQHKTLSYNCYRLNFDDCNLECEEKDNNKADSWTISSFYLSDIDETKMRLIEQPDGEWTLILESNMKIKYDEDSGSGLKRSLVLFNDEKEPLQEIGKALYFAIKSCKGLDRFKK